MGPPARQRTDGPRRPPPRVRPLRSPPALTVVVDQLAPPMTELEAAVWARVQLARHLGRPHTLELVANLADEFVELHGDRLFRDDPAIVGGLARIGERRVM